MTALDYILDGLEAALELERELGVRVVDCDRSLLQTAVPVSAAPAASVPTASAPAPAAVKPAFAQPKSVLPSPKPASAPVMAKGSTVYDFVFLHDGPLSPKGVEMMAKTIPAMGKTPETAPVAVAPPLPKAKVYIVMGRGALKRYLPGVKAAPGAWVRTPGGKDAVVTYSPDYLMRFTEITPAVQQMKSQMWQTLKGVVQRVLSGP